MNESTASPTPARCEYTWAFILLRLWVGLRTLLEGVEKFESGGKYSVANYKDAMTHMAQGITGASFLPLWATKLFAAPLGYILIILGAALILGIKPRLILILIGLLYVGLSFGLMAVQENEGVAWLGIHLILIVGALLLVRFDRFGLWSSRAD